MEIAKYPIPQHHLTTAIESLRELALRLELEASAFAQLPYRDAGAFGAGPAGAGEGRPGRLQLFSEPVGGAVCQE